MPQESKSLLPAVSFSYGQAFHVNDPRIGTTDIYGGTIVAKARAYQLVTSKTIAATEFRVTLAHVTTSQQLARIDNDTGAPGSRWARHPSIPQRVGAPELHARFCPEFLCAGGFARSSYGRTHAGGTTFNLGCSRDHRKAPVPSGGARWYENVGRKPLGDGFVAMPVREFRGAILRPFERQGIDVGVNFLWASGYGGQTLESLALPGEGEPFERITGFPIRSYVTASFYLSPSAGPFALIIKDGAVERT